MTTEQPRPDEQPEPEPEPDDEGQDAVPTAHEGAEGDDQTDDG